jgi:diguanylate cyclase (GGDEF)-like protein
MRLPSLGFRSQIALVFAVLAVMLSAALGLLAGQRAGAELSEILGRSLVDRAQGLAGAIARELDDRDLDARAAASAHLAGLETLRRPNDAAAQPGIELFVVGADRRVILGQGALAAGTPLDLASLRDGQSGRHGWRIERWPDGRDYLTGHSPALGHQGNPGLGWTVLARQEVDGALGPARALAVEILAWGCLLALVFAGLGWAAAGRMAAPVATIAEAADRIRQGLADRLPPVAGPSEVERLSGSLRALIGSLSRQGEAIGQQVERVHHDALTGAYSRAGFEHCAAQASEAAQSDGGALACLHLDLDGFTGVNARLGHPAGDEVLVEVARRLTVGLREGDVVARLGGNEFAVLLPLKESRSRAEVDRVASRIVAEICQPIATTAGEAKLGCSIGAALWRVQDGDIAEALQRAGRALHEARRAGGRRMAYDPALLAAD